MHARIHTHHSMHSDIRIFAPFLLAAWKSSVLSSPLHLAYSYPFFKVYLRHLLFGPYCTSNTPSFAFLPVLPHILWLSQPLCLSYPPKQPLSWGQASCLAPLAQTDSPMDFEFLEIGTGFTHLCIPEF